MRWLTLLSVFVFFALPARADDNCTLKNNYCVPFIGCTLDGQDFYVGRTFGRESGVLEARGLSGATCSGTWRRTALGIGRAEFSCSDGMSGRATYTYFDRSSGTAKGRGRTQGGDRLQFWAGHRIGAFILTDGGLDPDIAACVAQAMRAQG
ncbi:hypothetical protein [Tateyamaria sp. syn59]|uniref:hypothetical protein n=1 Tax=Tateyamaria sp. syn59 TaxID=2576942 RepID=UPI0011BDB884|nr:hypothetical protein [Tateyamaria sp. syn59]